ncbi:hypothetical protein Tco_0419098 [Tanacetum coccineum]
MRGASERETRIEGDSVERAATTTASLDAEQDSGNIIKTQSMTIPNEPFPQEISSGGSPRCQETTLGDMPAQTRFKRLSKQPHDSSLLRVNTLGSDEGSLKLQELTVLCTKLSTKVDSLEADLKQTKQIYGAAFTKLIKKVKTLEKTVNSSQARRKARIVVSDDEEDLEDPSKQGRKIAEIDEDPDISLVQHDAEVQGRHEHDMEPDFEFTTAKEVYTAKKGVSTTEPVFTGGASVSTAGASSAKDKGKAIIEEAETIQTKTKLQLEQERLDYEEALRLLAEIDEEERQRIARSRMSYTSDKGTTFGDSAARVGMQLRSSPNIDVVATFGVPLTIVGDLQKLINDIDAGKHDELLSELTNEDRMKTLEALGSICNLIKVDRNNADVIPCKVSYAYDSINLNVDESTIPSDPIVQSVDINKSTSYAGVAGGSAKDQPNVNSNS